MDSLFGSPGMQGRWAPSRRLSSASYALAELVYQRGDFAEALQMLVRREAMGEKDLPSCLLKGACLANLNRFGEAESAFSFAANRVKSPLIKEKALFNKGLVLCLRDLATTGDCTIPGSMRWQVHVAHAHQDFPSGLPFDSALKTWHSLLRKGTHHGFLIHAYLAFGHLQHGDLQRSLQHISESIALNDSFYVSSLVAGKIFMELFHLALDGTSFPIPLTTAEVFAIEPSEIAEMKDKQPVLHRESLLELALQCLLESHEQTPLSLPVLLDLSHVYWLAEMREEACQMLDAARDMAGDILPVLKGYLRIVESMDNDPTTTDRITQAMIQGSLSGPDFLQCVIPQHYLI